MVIFDKLAVFVLGLENDIWESIGKGEKYLYKSLTIAFSVFAVLSLFSGCFLIYLISSNTIVSFLFGIMVAYVVTSTVRFSLVILRKSVFPDPVNNTILTLPVDLIQETSITSSTEEEPLPNVDQKNPFILLNKIKSIFLTFSIRSFFPDMGIIIRIVVLSTMCLLVVFPLSSLIYLRSINSICENERQELLSIFKQQNMDLLQTQMKSYETRIGILDQQIDDLRKSGIDGNAFGNSIKAQRENLFNDMQLYKAKQEDKISSDFAAYKSKISNKYFVVKCFTEVSKFHLFPFVFSLVFFLLLYPHIQLIILKKGAKYQYAKLSTNHYRSIIEENYYRKQSHLETFLKNKYPELYPTLHKIKMYSDPPFCSLRNDFFSTRKSMTKTEFEASFNK